MSQVDSDFDNLGFDQPIEGDFPPSEEVVPSKPPAPKYRKQEINVYTFLLITSFVLMLIATVLLFMEVGRFS